VNPRAKLPGARSGGRLIRVLRLAILENTFFNPEIEHVETITVPASVKGLPAVEAGIQVHL
jgi:hypothetical protein